MENKICVITGCNSGIGKVTAIELAKMGFEIIMLVRDSQKSRDAFNEIKRESGSDQVALKYVDLSSLESIKNVAEEIKSDYTGIDLLINNAGIFKRKLDKSVDSFEMTIAVNYIATFTLTNHLMPLLKKNKNARIINLTSELYKRGKIHLDNQFSPDKFNGDKAYANSKLLVIYFTKELSRLIENNNLIVNCVHPCVVGTNVFREYPKWFAKFINLLISKPEEGAKPSIYLASSEEINGVTGKYFYKTKLKETEKVANDMELAKKIWKETENITDIRYL